MNPVNDSEKDKPGQPGDEQERKKTEEGGKRLKERWEQQRKELGKVKATRNVFDPLSSVSAPYLDHSVTGGAESLLRYQATSASPLPYSLASYAYDPSTLAMRAIEQSHANLTTSPIITIVNPAALGTVMDPTRVGLPYTSTSALAVAMPKSSESVTKEELEERDKGIASEFETIKKTNEEQQRAAKEHVGALEKEVKVYRKAEESRRAPDPKAWAEASLRGANDEIRRYVSSLQKSERKMLWRCGGGCKGTLAGRNSHLPTWRNFDAIVVAIQASGREDGVVCPKCHARNYISLRGTKMQFYTEVDMTNDKTMHYIVERDDGKVDSGTEGA